MYNGDAPLSTLLPRMAMCMTVFVHAVDKEASDSDERKIPPIHLAPKVATSRALGRPCRLHRSNDTQARFVLGAGLDRAWEIY